MCEPFGKRTGVKDMATGERHASSTYGKASNMCFCPKVNANIPFLLEREAGGLVSQGLSFAPDVIKFVPQGVAVNLLTGALLHTREAREEHLKTYADDADQVIYTADFLIGLANDLQFLTPRAASTFMSTETKQLQGAIQRDASAQDGDRKILETPLTHGCVKVTADDFSWFKGSR